MSLLLRSVGVLSHMIIADRVGAEALGVSSLVVGVSGFAVTLAVSGIQLGTTRLCSQGLGRGDDAFVHRALRCSIAHALCFGLLAAGLMIAFAPLIGKYWIRDARAVSALRILGISLPFIALASCLSGYFVAVRRAYKSASVQVPEEVVRVALTLFLLDRMAGRGLESALTALALSAAIADVFSGLALSALYLWDRKRHFPPLSKHASPPSYTDIGHSLLGITLPLSVAAYVRSGLVTLQHTFIPIGLERYGLTTSASLATYGQVQSMALPVLLFPAAPLAAFAGLLIPEVTEAQVRGERQSIQSLSKSVYRWALIYAIGVSGLMIAFSHELGALLYDSREAGAYIRLLAPLIPVMYIDSATDAILKGLGEQVYSMKVNIIDAAASLLLVWLLTPTLGIVGYLIAIYATEILNAALSIVRLLQRTEVRLPVMALVAKPLVCIVGATSVTRLLYALFPVALTPVAQTTQLVILFVISLLMYWGFLRLFKGIGKNEYGEKMEIRLKKQKQPHII